MPHRKLLHFALQSRQILLDLVPPHYQSRPRSRQPQKAEERQKVGDVVNEYNHLAELSASPERPHDRWQSFTPTAHQNKYWKSQSKRFPREPQLRRTLWADVLHRHDTEELRNNHHGTNRAVKAFNVGALDRRNGLKNRHVRGQPQMLHRPHHHRKTWWQTRLFHNRTTKFFLNFHFCRLFPVGVQSEMKTAVLMKTSRDFVCDLNPQWVPLKLLRKLPFNSCIGVALKESFDGAGFEAMSNLIFREIPVWINFYQLMPTRLVFKDDSACTYKLYFFGFKPWMAMCWYSHKFTMCDAKSNFLKGNTFTRLSFQYRTTVWCMSASNRHWSFEGSSFASVFISTACNHRRRTSKENRSRRKIIGNRRNYQ